MSAPLTGPAGDAAAAIDDARVRAEPITLGEGATPTIESTSLARLFRLHRLAFKLEGSNPTGSWIDRGSVALVQHARASGVRRAVAIADVATVASTARYCARAGIRLTVVAAHGDLDGYLYDAGAGDERVAGDHALDEWVAGPRPSLAGARSLARDDHAGARVIVTSERAGGTKGRKGSNAAAIRRAVADAGLALLDPGDPIWAAGLRTLAYELMESFPLANAAPPHTAATPHAIDADVGSAATVVIARLIGIEDRALVEGFRAWRAAGLGAHEPAVVAVALGPASTPDGRDVDIRDAHAARRLLAEEEGIAVSPASAAALAGLIRMVRAGEIDPHGRVTVVLAAEALSRAATPLDDPRRVGRLLTDVPLADLARVLAAPAI